jgi:hypothetical protein
METKISESLRDTAIKILQKRHKAKNLRLGYIEMDDIPSSGKKLYRIDAFAAGDPNGPRYSVVVDEDHQETDPKKLGEKEGKVFFTHAAIAAAKPLPTASPAASITIDPTENNLVLNPGDTFEEVIKVFVPGDAGVTKVDTYFLADTTSSMSGILASVQGGANNILTALSGLGLDMAFGVGNYKDFPNDAYAFQHQQSPTTTLTDVANAINSWSANGGSDTPEGQLFAMDQLSEAPGGTIGWRTGAKRIVVWFGDAPGHDPVCSAISGLPYDISEASMTAKLVAQNITVVAISTDTGIAGALNGDPTLGGDYTAACGPAGGSPNQADRIVNATGGTHVAGIDETTIVNTIINLVSSAALTINNLNLAATGDSAAFVVSITPAGGYGPLSGSDDHELTFKVEFKGVAPCKDEDQHFKGFIEAIADGVVVARKRVLITVPACKPKELYSYSVKFICGHQESCECSCPTGVLPGRYATEINIHNFHDVKVPIEKSLLPVVLAGAPLGREPRHVNRTARDRIVLPGNSATMDDCCRLADMLFDGAPPDKLPLTIGFLEIVSPVELNVTAVYTATDPASNGLSIDVEQIEGKRKNMKARPPISPSDDFTAVTKLPHGS